jgi:hypothetical protein
MGGTVRKKETNLVKKDELLVLACTNCKETKSINDFNKNHNATTGRVSHCKACMAKTSKYHKTLKSKRVKIEEFEGSWLQDSLYC